MKLKLKDPWSAITHGIALLLAAAGAAPLLLKAAHGENAPLHITALAIFILTMILLYTASTVYHSVDSTEKVNRRLRKMDHMMIFVMIAGSYTPICLIALHNRTGCMEYRNPRYSSQRIMDHMSQMAFFRTLYWNGMALCTCFRSYLSFPSASRIWMASCRWYHLYDRWCDL